MKRIFIIFSALILTAFLFFGTQVSGQDIKPLTIGEKMPDVVLKSMINYSSNSAKLSDFKGKALILDFWFIACGSCREAMPHLDSLQKFFKNDLQLLLVTWEDKKKVEDFFATDLNAKNLKFVHVVDDTVLRKIFPATGFPHQIWIDKNQKIISITDGSNTSFENIQKLISSNVIDLPVKSDETNRDLAVGRDPLINYRYESNKDKILRYSYFSKSRPEFQGGSSLRVDTINKLSRASFRNVDFLWLYNIAYTSSLSSDDLHRPTRILRKDTNPIRSEADFKTYSNVFCYDLIYEDTTTSNFGKYMVRDLDNYFGVKSHEEIKRIKCLIIRKKGEGKSFLQSMDGNDKKFIDARLGEGKIFRANKIWKETLGRILNQNTRIPIILDLDCGRYQPISLSFTWKPGDIEAMSKDLEKFGLEMVVQKRKRKIIIIENI